MPAIVPARGRRLVDGARPRPVGRSIGRGRLKPVSPSRVRAAGVTRLIGRRRLLGLMLSLCAGPAAAQQEIGSGAAMPHVVLLGDSVFDNARYVPGQPDVVAQLRAALAPDGRATLAAVDGSVAADVPRQLAGLPGDATHLVISAGGNDALGASGLLDRAVGSVAEAVHALAVVQGRFHAAYRAMLEAVLARDRPTAVCTIYDPRYPDERRRLVTRAALALFNDVITREAFARDLPVIDLRLLCNEDADFANPIEPSSQGGEKIAGAVRAFLLGPAPDRSRVIAR